jgi:hypothetical protein
MRVGPMRLSIGARLYSPTSSIEVIVLRAPAHPVNLTCDGVPMVVVDRFDPPRAADGTSGAGALAAGKRYTDPEQSLELLVTKAGRGPLAADGTALEIQGPKRLPSSD